MTRNDTRAQRSKVALRDNLRRRKTQARGRETDAPPLVEAPAPAIEEPHGEIDPLSDKTSV